MLNLFSRSSQVKLSEQAEAKLKKGLELLEVEKQGQAEKFIAESLDLDPQGAAVLVREQFHQYYEDSKVVETLVLGTCLGKHWSGDSKFLIRMGNLHRKLTDNKKANEFYKRGIAQDKRSTIAYYNLAASMAKVPLYDEALLKLIEKYIQFDSFLLPSSTFPRDPQIIDHLTEMLNMKVFFGKLERLQELIFKHELKNETPDLEKIDLMVQRIKEKFNQKIEQDRQSPNAARLLKETINLEWSKLSAGEQDRFLWDVLNLALFIFKQTNRLPPEESGLTNVEKLDLQLAVDCFVKLKVEQYSFRYLDMIAELRHAVDGNYKQSIESLKALLKNDPNDRYLNVNLGLLYHHTGNKLLSLVHLLKGAFIIQELGGVWDLDDIIEQGSRAYKEGKLKRALRIYKTASLETESVEILTRIGEILISLHRYEEAIQPFKDIVRINPDSDLAKEKLTEIQDHFSFLADEFFNAREFVKSSEQLEKALEVSRTSDLLKIAIKTYKLQGDHDKEFALQEEYQKVLAQERLKSESEKRQKHIEKAIAQMKSGDLQKAIEQFNEAFRIRMDRDVFMYLSYLYKKLNQKRALQELVRQWNAMMKSEVSE